MQRVQANSQQQVVEKKTRADQIHYSIGATSNSERWQLIQTTDKLRVWEVGILPKTENEFFINNSKIETVVIVHGAGGNHEIMKEDLKAIKEYAKSKNAKILLVSDIVRSHLAPKRLRENCNIINEIATAMFTPSTWNKVEENLDSIVRDLTYRSAFENVSFEEILQNKHNETCDAIVEKLDEQASLSGDELLIREQNVAGHKALSRLSVRQLCRDHESLGVKPTESIYMFYGRAIVSDMSI